jgi:hypothetical protein
MSKVGVLFWIGIFFLWIIYLRMQKEKEAAAVRQKDDAIQKNE